MTKPDFIIIGAMKSATSTLHSQLAMQSGIFMTDPKEPNYFSDDEQYLRGDDWYSSLFTEANTSDICGESSTHYTKLPDFPLTVERMARRLTAPKLIYVMRHPIDRLVSHYIHQWSQKVINCDINQAIDEHEELAAYSCYSKQLLPYFEQFGADNVLPIFTEAIRQHPQEQLEKVARFIGCDSNVTWHSDLSEQNISKERIRKFLGYQFLIESSLMKLVRRNLIPVSVRNKVKNKFTMQSRPDIDQKHLEQLTVRFDEDLKKLEGWLGIKLTCENYRDLVMGL